jgi:large subunit ribosomal protein L4
VKAVATSTEAGATGTAPAASEAPASEAAAEEWPNSAAPLESGEAPEGYEIKAKKDSMKYHAPGGRWYDNTVAEVWFKTAADAEAAGFVQAGTKAQGNQDEKDGEAK